VKYDNEFYFECNGKKFIFFSGSLISTKKIKRDVVFYFKYRTYILKLKLGRYETWTQELLKIAPKLKNGAYYFLFYRKRPLPYRSGVIIKAIRNRKLL
jgi:hypothetical protein